MRPLWSDKRKCWKVVASYGRFPPLPPKVSVSKCEKLQEVQAVILKVLKLGAGERDGTEKSSQREKQR